MTFEDIPAEIRRYGILCDDVLHDRLYDGIVLSMKADKGIDSLLNIEQESAITRVRVPNSFEASDLIGRISGSYLARVVSSLSNGTAILELISFRGQELVLGELALGVSVDTEKRLCLEYGASFEVLSKRLAGDFVYAHGTDNFFFVMTGRAENLSLSPQDEQCENSAFCVVGDEMRLSASKILCGAFQDNGYSVTRFHKSRRKEDTLRLARGTTRFCRMEEVAPARASTVEMLESLCRTDMKYLRKWDEFAHLEGRVLLDDACKMGVLKIAGFKQREDGIVVYLVDKPNNDVLKKAKELCFYEEMPIYLSHDFKDRVRSVADKKLKTGETVDDISMALDLITTDAKERRARNLISDSMMIRPIGRDMCDVNERCILLDAEALPKQKGFLVPGILGDVKQITRRREARERILTGNSANPYLKYLIEDLGKINTGRPGNLVVETPKLLNTVYSASRRPTTSQKEAISIALNTPDIALIQGPPGTGKTTVIAAIVSRLEEEMDRSAGRCGRFLLTSTQHDAVENILSRLSSADGLPIANLSTRHRAGDNDSESRKDYSKIVSEWSKRLADRLHEKFGTTAFVERKSALETIVCEYLRHPTPEIERRMLEMVLDSRLKMPPKIVARAREIDEKFFKRSGSDIDLPNAIRAVRSIRYSAEGFADDGIERLRYALVSLGDYIPGEERAFIENVIFGVEDGTSESVLSKIRDFRRGLLERLIAPPESGIYKAKRKIEDFAREVLSALDAIKKAYREDSSDVTLPIADFIDALTTDVPAIVEAAKEYSPAFGVTCQQSVNFSVCEFKAKHIQHDFFDDKIAPGAANLEYDYVIVDEAARVSPLDLMIVMSQGKKIVLVGDHRQLSQIVDKEVVEKMEGASTDGEMKWIEKSMFEYLFTERLNALTLQDGFCRCVTLNEQYRMHPLLGQFVSKNFYERYGEKFLSPLTDVSLFAHNLPGTENMPAVWFDVPASRENRQQKDPETKSWYRDSELDLIVAKVREWIRSDAGADLIEKVQGNGHTDEKVFGLITFYSAQAKRLEDKLKRELEPEEFDLIRVGTVDAFQGREFDIVMLSLVRTSSVDVKSDEDDESVARKTFGFLTSYNRMNVAMSRQKRLLAVVGDSAITRHRLSEKYIWGLRNFYELCSDSNKGLVVR